MKKCNILKINIIKNLATVFLLLNTLSCQNKEDNKLIGELLGSAIGAYLGSSIGNESTKAISTIIGTTAGYLIGGKIVEFLDEEEITELENSIQTTLNQNVTNDSTLWESSKLKDTSVLITPTKDFTKNNFKCREYQKMITRDNKQILENSKVCRDKDGNWKKLATS